MKNWFGLLLCVFALSSQAQNWKNSDSLKISVHYLNGDALMRQAPSTLEQTVSGSDTVFRIQNEDVTLQWNPKTESFTLEALAIDGQRSEPNIETYRAFQEHTVPMYFYKLEEKSIVVALFNTYQ